MARAMPTKDQFILRLKERTGSDRKKIALPDALDERTLSAAAVLQRDAIAAPVLVGDKKLILDRASRAGIDLGGIRIEDPADSGYRTHFSEEFLRLRKGKGMTGSEAERLMFNPLYFAGMMVREGRADGSVAGSVSTTADVLRAALQTIGLNGSATFISSFFLMAMRDNILAFADCGVVPEPDAKQLAEIGWSTADNYRKLTGEEPRIALLSFSTRGSASHALVNKVREASEILRAERPDLLSDGELQVDAAIVPDVAKVKAPGSPLEGKANVLVFPDLNSGNIAYKLVQRFSGAEAFGPIMQGLAKPAFDLSRGCSVTDIIGMAIINAAFGG